MSFLGDYSGKKGFHTEKTPVTSLAQDKDLVDVEVGLAGHNQTVILSIVLFNLSIQKLA